MVRCLYITFYRQITFLISCNELADAVEKKALQQRVEVLERARVTLERVVVVVISEHRCFEPESRIHRLALYKRWLELHPGFYHVSGICRHQPQG